MIDERNTAEALSEAHVVEKIQTKTAAMATKIKPNAPAARLK